MSWERKALAEERRYALDPQGYYIAAAPLTSLLRSALIGLGLAAALDLFGIWALGRPPMIEQPYIYLLVPSVAAFHWWRQRASYREYDHNREMYDAAARAEPAAHTPKEQS